MIHHVSADRVMLVHRERDFQLRANAIDARDQNGIAHCAEVRAKQTAEAADFSEHVRPVRLLNERLNAALEFVAKIDIYARRSVGRSFSCHVERSRDISYCFFGRRLTEISRDSSTSLGMTE